MPMFTLEAMGWLGWQGDKSASCDIVTVGQECEQVIYACVGACERGSENGGRVTKMCEEAQHMVGTSMQKVSCGPVRRSSNKFKHSRAA